MLDLVFEELSQPLNGYLWQLTVNISRSLWSSPASRDLSGFAFGIESPGGDEEDDGDDNNNADDDDNGDHRDDGRRGGYGSSDRSGARSWEMFVFSFEEIVKIDLREKLETEIFVRKKKDGPLAKISSSSSSPSSKGETRGGSRAYERIVEEGVRRSLGNLVEELVVRSSKYRCCCDFVGANDDDDNNNDNDNLRYEENRGFPSNDQGGGTAAATYEKCGSVSGGIYGRLPPIDEERFEKEHMFCRLLENNATAEATTKEGRTDPFRRRESTTAVGATLLVVGVNGRLVPSFVARARCSLQIVLDEAVRENF
jgi:hypothetical protein